MRTISIIALLLSVAALVVLGYMEGEKAEKRLTRLERVQQETTQNALTWERHEKAKYKLAGVQACKECASMACRRIGL